MTSADPEDRYNPTPRTLPSRSAQRVSYDRQQVHAVLDDGFVCHVGFVVDGAPVVLPHLYARDGDTLYLHGSTGARALRTAVPEGLAVCVTVTLVDGLVFARSAFHHSINYRCVVVHGVAAPVLDDSDKRFALEAVVNAAAPGRAAQSRPPSAKELAATVVLALPLEEVSLKTRSGPPIDDEEDLALDYWAGVLPLTTVAAAPIPAAGVQAAVPSNVALWS